MTKEQRTKLVALCNNVSDFDGEYIIRDDGINRIMGNLPMRVADADAIFFLSENIRASMNFVRKATRFIEEVSK